MPYLNATPAIGYVHAGWLYFLFQSSYGWILPASLN